MEKMGKSLKYQKQLAAQMDKNEHLAFIGSIVRTKHQYTKKSNPVTTQRPITYRSGNKKPTTRPHIPKNLLAKIPTPAEPKNGLTWVEQTKKRVVYDTNIQWEQSTQPSTQPQQRPEVNNRNDKQGDENLEMTDMKQGQSLERLGEGKGQ